MHEMLRRYRAQIIAYILKLYHKPIVGSDVSLDLILVDIFFDGYKLLRGNRYDIFRNKQHVGYLSIFFGTSGKVITACGHIGIEIFIPYREQGIGLSCINYSIQILLEKQRKCTIVTNSSNVLMQQLLEKTQYKMVSFKSDYYYYEYEQ